MEYTIREIIAQKGGILAETDYAASVSDMLDFRLFSDDFYQWKEKKLLFKDCVIVSDFEQVAAMFPPFRKVCYKSRQKLPYFTNHLERFTEAMQNGESIAVEGGPCLFGEHEVSIAVRLRNGCTQWFDFANGKKYDCDDAPASGSEPESLISYLQLYGMQTESITFHKIKQGLTPQEYLGLRYPFEIAKAAGASLVIPIPDMSYRKFLESVLQLVPESVRIAALAEFDVISAEITAYYLENIEALQTFFQIPQFCCLHSRCRNELELWYQKRAPYMERHKVLRNLTSKPEKLEPVKDYVSMPALPYYLFGITNILEINSVDETDPFRKCQKAHKNTLKMGCILFPELLSGDNDHTFYKVSPQWKAYGNYCELTNNYCKGV